MMNGMDVALCLSFILIFYLVKGVKMRKQLSLKYLIPGMFTFFSFILNVNALCQNISVELILLPNIQHSQVFFVSDFDLMQLGAGPELFQIIVNNGGPAKEVFGRFSIVTDNFGMLLTGKTKPFMLATGATIITNRELFSANSIYALDDYSLEAAASELRSILLRTGKLPSDTYNFTWEIYDSQTGQLEASATEPLIITNPTHLDLIAPGMDASVSSHTILFTTTPMFQWESNAADFILTVCEKLYPDQTPEEVMTGRPRLRLRLKNQTFAMYPYSTNPGDIVLPLEERKTYYWQVKLIVPTSSGAIELGSEIWGFTVANPADIIANIEHMRVLNDLRAILGDAMVDLLFGASGELEGFHITGVFLFNGKRISLEGLKALVKKVLSEEIKVKSFVVE